MVALPRYSRHVPTTTRDMRARWNAVDGVGLLRGSHGFTRAFIFVGKGAGLFSSLDGSKHIQFVIYQLTSRVGTSLGTLKHELPGLL